MSITTTDTQQQLLLDQIAALRARSATELAGKIITVSSPKGGQGKTVLAKELAWLLGAVLVDLDWDGGRVSTLLGYPTHKHVNAPLLDALARDDQIDLSTDNAEELRDALRPIHRARPAAPAAANASAPPKPPQPPNRPRRPTANRTRPSGPGPAKTATTSPTAAASPPTSSPPTTKKK